MAVSLYGNYIFKRRYGGNYQNYFKDLIKSQFISSFQMKELVRKKMLDMLSHAFENVPFYQEWSQEMSLTMNDFNSVTDLQKLPVIDKEQVRKNPTLFCARNLIVSKKYFVIF